MHAPWFLNSTSRAPHLRIGVLLDGPAHCRLTWQRPSNTSQTAILPAWNWWFSTPMRRDAEEATRTGLFARYLAWDAKRISEAPDPLARGRLHALFQRCRVLSVTPIADQNSQRFPEDAVARIREKNLDVLVKFGFQPLRGEILHAARYGVWAYHHGDPDHYRGGPPYFWEVYEDNLLSCAALERLTDEPDAGQILYKGVVCDDSGKLLGPQSRAAVLGLDYVPHPKAPSTARIRLGKHRSCYSASRLEVGRKPTRFQPMPRCCRGSAKSWLRHLCSARATFDSLAKSFRIGCSE